MPKSKNLFGLYVQVLWVMMIWYGPATLNQVIFCSEVRVHCKLTICFKVGLLALIVIKDKFPLRLLIFPLHLLIPPFPLSIFFSHFFPKYPSPPPLVLSFLLHSSLRLTHTQTHPIIPSLAWWRGEERHRRTARR